MRRAILTHIAMGTVTFIGVIPFAIWRGVFIATPRGSLEVGLGGVGYTPAAERWAVILLPRQLPVTQVDWVRLPWAEHTHIGWFISCPWWPIVATWALVSLLAWRWSKPRKVAAFPVETKPPAPVE